MLRGTVEDASTGTDSDYSKPSAPPAASRTELSHTTTLTQFLDILIPLFEGKRVLL